MLQLGVGMTKHKHLEHPSFLLVMSLRCRKGEEPLTCSVKPSPTIQVFTGFLLHCKELVISINVPELELKRNAFEKKILECCLFKISESISNHHGHRRRGQWISKSGAPPNQSLSSVQWVHIQLQYHAGIPSFKHTLSRLGCQIIYPHI